MEPANRPNGFLADPKISSVFRRNSSGRLREEIFLLFRSWRVTATGGQGFLLVVAHRAGCGAGGACICRAGAGSYCCALREGGGEQLLACYGVRSSRWGLPGAAGRGLATAAGGSTAATAVMRCRDVYW